MSRMRQGVHQAVRAASSPEDPRQGEGHRGEDRGAEQVLQQERAARVHPQADEEDRRPPVQASPALRKWYRVLMNVLVLV